MKICEFCEKDTPELRLFKDRLGTRICATCHNNLAPIVVSNRTGFLEGENDIKRTYRRQSRPCSLFFYVWHCCYDLCYYYHLCNYSNKARVKHRNKPIYARQEGLYSLLFLFYYNFNTLVCWKIRAFLADFINPVLLEGSP